MFRLLLILGGGLFLVLLIGGRDGGQIRAGLQGTYAIAALENAAPTRAEVTAPVAAAVAEPVSAPPRVPAPALPEPQAAFAAATALDQGAAAQNGLTLLLPPAIQTVAPRTTTAAVTAAAPPLRIGRILGSAVNVREGPSAKAAVLDRLARDEVVTVISSDSSGWSIIRVEGGGVEGYVATRYLADLADTGALFPPN